MTSDHGSPGLTGRGLDARIVRQNILGPMELEVLARIAEGLSDAEIARHMGVTVGGVRYCVRNCLAKLGAVNRPHAVAIALSARMIQIA